MTPKQERFCQEYAYGNLSAEEAAQRAGYCSKHSGKRLLKNQHIQERISRIRKEEKQPEKEKLRDASWVIEQYIQIAQAQITDYMEVVEKRETEGGREQVKQILQIKPTERLSQDKRSAIKEIRQTSYGIELKLYDKKAALDVLAKYYGIFDPGEEADVVELPEENVVRGGVVILPEVIKHSKE